MKSLILLVSGFYEDLAWPGWALNYKIVIKSPKKAGEVQEKELLTNFLSSASGITNFDVFFNLFSSAGFFFGPDFCILWKNLSSAGEYTSRSKAEIKFV